MQKLENNGRNILEGQVWLFSVSSSTSNYKKVDGLVDSSCLLTNVTQGSRRFVLNFVLLNKDSHQKKLIFLLPRVQHVQVLML